MISILFVPDTISILFCLYQTQSVFCFVCTRHNQRFVCARHNQGFVSDMISVLFVPDTTSGEEKGQLAVLCRSNYTVFAEAVAICVYSDKPVRVAFVGVSMFLCASVYFTVCLSV